MAEGYEVRGPSGERAWWDGKKLTPLDERGFQMKRPPAQSGPVDPQAFRRSQDSIAAIDDAKKRTNWLRTGPVGAMTKGWPGSPAFNLDKDLDTLKARAGFEELAAMRKASPTGGALGQVTERELAMLQASEANLDVGQGEKQIDRNLDRFRGTLTSRTPGLAPENPFALTSENKAAIPEGAFFRHEGKVYRQKKDAGPAGGNIRTVNTPQEAAALPPGTKFRTPDGQVRVRK